MYFSKGTQISDDFCQMLSNFTQFHSITDNQAASKSFSASQSLGNSKQYKYICTNHEQSGHFSSSFQSNQTDIDCIPQMTKANTQGPYVGFWGPCPVHPMYSQTWGDCFNIPKNKTSDGQQNNNHNKESHNWHGYYYSYRGQGCGQWQGHGSYNAP
jgi:hypothetical protein